MIQLTNVTKTYTTSNINFDALKNVNLLVKKGEYLALIGKSGCGKTTLLNLITGIDHPTLGTIKVNGTEISQMNESELAKWRGERIGIIFQFFQLIPTLTIIENLLLAMEFVNVIPKKNRLHRAENLLAEVDISDQADKMPSALSGGEQQRAAIARAMANNPEIIVADEPTGNLDSKTAVSIHYLLNSLAKSGKTVIVVTHEKDIDLNYDRVIHLSDGEILSKNQESRLR